MRRGLLRRGHGHPPGQPAAAARGPLLGCAGAREGQTEAAPDRIAQAALRKGRKDEAADPLHGLRAQGGEGVRQAGSRLQVPPQEGRQKTRPEAEARARLQARLSAAAPGAAALRDRKSTRLNSSHANISYAV